MKLYRKLIRPMHSYPGPDYSPRVMPIEAEVKWYPEEEREQLENKYASYNEGSFSDLIFEEKFEPYAVEPKGSIANMADIEKVIKELDRMTEEARAMDLEWAIGIDDFATLCEALELLKEYKAIKETISDEIHETAKMFRRTEDDGCIERCDRRAKQSLSVVQNAGRR